ncbi:MAG TPA: tetratricopeptide repeat protein, partial [Candidatus Rifleibacterium sp.]|nr:tetratricopeptide repeat protein [Candidatus Rifleibacterium sp.]
FGIEEIRFEKTKPSDFNLTLLKKYISEQPGNMLAQLHAISRWFSLIKLSDTPRRDELIKMSTSLFKSTGKKDFTPEERLRDIFFNGLLLSIDKTDDPKNEKDHALEELLLDSEERLGKNGDYWLIKAIVFQALRHRPNGYFEPMKPEEDLKRALTLIPRTAHYYYVMGQAFRFLGSMDTSLFLSIASYEKASSLDPRNAKLQNSLLGIYMGLHEDYQTRNKPEPFWLEEAVYKKILELSPNNPHALNNLGYLYAEYGVNTQMAQELCQRAVDMDPANPGFRDSLGWAAFKNRDFKKAEEELKKSLSMKMNVYDTHYHLATVYYATGELDKAAEHYQEAIKIRPDSAEALNNLAYLYTEQNSNIKQAIEMAETAVQLEKNNASYIDTLGWAYYRDGDLDKALVYLLKANQIVSGQGEVLLHIGRVYLDKNDFDSAIAYLKEAFKADPKLKDPDNSLYLAVRLKSYHSALADYHTLMGERADKERINNILMSIARLYQEEKLYDKAIDITKLCSDVKSGIRPLSEPLFNSYNLADSSKPSLTLDEAPDSATASESLQIAAPEAQTTSENAESEKPVDKLFNGLPPVSSHTLVISFGPQFFRWLGTSIAGAANFADKSVTIFVNKPFKPRKNAVIRIETESITGTAMLGLLSNYFSQLNIVRKNDEQPDRCEFSLGKRRIYAVADRNSVYLSGRLLSEGDRIELLSQLCPFNPESFIELIYNWENFAAFIPQMLQPFVKNPFAPFIRIHTKYSYKDGNLNEFSAATTGKAENDEFMKRFARSLFAFKVQTQQMGLETVIKVRGDEDVIYISTDFENIAGWLTKRFNRWYGLASKLLEIYMSRTICFMNRMFYSPELEKSCPTGGSIRTDAVSGLIYCNQHNEVPAIPMILDEHACCSYNRTRLFRYLQNTRAINASGTLETGSIEELAKKLGVPLCPTTGTWTIDAKGIKCSEHEN